MVAANIGIGMLPHHLVRPFVEAGRLWQLPPYGNLPVSEVFLISNPNAMLNPAEQAFMAVMDGLDLFEDEVQHQSD